MAITSGQRDGIFVQISCGCSAFGESVLRRSVDPKQDLVRAVEQAPLAVSRVPWPTTRPGGPPGRRPRLRVGPSPGLAARWPTPWPPPRGRWSSCPIQCLAMVRPPEAHQPPFHGGPAFRFPPARQRQPSLRGNACNSCAGARQSSMGRRHPQDQCLPLDQGSSSRHPFDHEPDSWPARDPSRLARGRSPLGSSKRWGSFAFLWLRRRNAGGRKGSSTKGLLKKIGGQGNRYPAVPVVRAPGSRPKAIGHGRWAACCVFRSCGKGCRDLLGLGVL